MIIPKENKFKRLALGICENLVNTGVPCYVRHCNRHNNTIYIQLGRKPDRYNSIRISDHPGKMIAKFSLRSDLKQSEKISLANHQFLCYTLMDTLGMILRIKKEFRNENNCVANRV